MKKLCPECRNSRFEEDDIHDEIICRQCGLVLDAPPCYDFRPAGYIYIRDVKGK
jgi:transcription initiation factor TFIIIB Brf1 subunit/transcription initiation factor TFIIB